MKTLKPNLIYTGRGTPVLLLHSSLGSKLQWYRFMQSMSKNYLMVAPDLYGYGESPFPPDRENFGLIHEVSLVESLMHELVPEDQSIHVVGHSYGAATALRMAYKYRGTDRVSSLSIYEPVAFHLLPEHDEALEQVIAFQKIVDDELDKGNPGKAARFFIDFWSGKGTYDGFPEGVRELFDEAIKKLPLDFQALTGDPLSLEDYKTIDTPVCLMAGNQSPIHSRRVSELLAQTLPDCRTHWLEAGHMAPVQQADQVNGIMELFIKSVS